MQNFKRIHFIGIGGVGMSALAWVLARQGYIVSGSDISANSLTARLQSAGVTIYIGHRAENVVGAELVVISSAIRPDNPELQYAMKRNLPVWHRAKLLGYLLNDKRGITISGTHGKTTTTSMISLILRESGLDPTILIGGEVNDVGGNAVFGKGEFVVAEADESDGSFLHLRSEIAVITNIEEEHRDFYMDLRHELEFFIQFISNVKENGVVVVCLEDYGACQIIDRVNRRFFTYAVNDSAADLYATDLQLYPWGSEYTCVYKEKLMGNVQLSVPGIHNISNSLAALSVGFILGLQFEKMASILANFHGAARRFQVKGHTAGITVIDDYAHHPTEVKATLLAAKKVAKERGGRLITVFQPHRYSRTYYLGHKFGEAFDSADIVLITDVYSAGETPIEGVSGEIIYNAVRENGHTNVEYVPKMEEMPEKLLGLLQENDVLITMGAGNIWTIGEKVIAALSNKETCEAVK